MSIVNKKTDALSGRQSTGVVQWKEDERGFTKPTIRVLVDREERGVA